MMTKAFTVARWEYVEKIKSKTFLITLFLMPIIMIGFGLLSGLLASQPDTGSKVIGIIDLSGAIGQPLAKYLEEHYRLPDGGPNYVLRPLEISEGVEMNQLKRQSDSLTANGEIEGYLIVGKSILTDTSVEYRSQNIGNLRVTERMSRAIRDLVIEQKLISQGLNPKLTKDLTRPIDLKTIKLSKSGKEEEAGFEKVFFTSYIFMMMMFFLVMTSGQLLVRSMLEEKSNRVVEVLMSSCSSTDLMAGKIIGLSGLGFTQIGFWAAIGIAISLNYAITMISIGSALLLLVYFVLGYLLYAAIFVAAGSPVSTEQEAQQITSYLTIVLILPIVLVIPILQDPNSLMVKVMTFIPLLTPTMMAMRIPIQMPSELEIILSIAILFFSMVGAVWIAGKIFRTAILVYGKRPTLPELFRILRTP